MRKIIERKRYDTDTARKVGEYSNGGSWRDFSHYEEALYCKRGGEYFLAGEGGPSTKYQQTAGLNQWTGGGDIIPMTADEAAEWAEKHLTAEEYEAEFSVVEDDRGNSVGIAIKAAREAASMTQTALADKMDTDQRQVWRWETGESVPDGYQLIKLGQALGIDPGQLLR